MSVAIITNEDLRHNKYDIPTLEANIANFDLRRLLSTQRLTPYFCVKYILSEEYSSCVEDTYLCDGDVLYWQPHITKDELREAWNQYSSGEYDDPKPESVSPSPTNTEKRQN